MTKSEYKYVRARVTLRLTVSQYVLVSSPLWGRLTRYCFLFKSFGLEFVVLSLWGALSDERPGLSFYKYGTIVKQFMWTKTRIKIVLK
jgi:hypothetical protein